MCRAHPEGRVTFKLERESKPSSAAEVRLEGAARGKCRLQNRIFFIWAGADFSLLVFFFLFGGFCLVWGSRVFLVLFLIKAHCGTRGRVTVQSRGLSMLHRYFSVPSILSCFLCFNIKAAFLNLSERQSKYTSHSPPLSCIRSAN